jgi:hypothetical protein
MESNTMIARRGHLATLWITLLACGCSSTGQIGTLQTQNRSLLEQNRAQLAEMENLKAHARRLEDKLIDAERQQGEGQIDRSRVAASERDSASVFDRSADPVDDGEAAGAEGARRR